MSASVKDKMITKKRFLWGIGEGSQEEEGDLRTQSDENPSHS